MSEGPDQPSDDQDLVIRDYEGGKPKLIAAGKRKWSAAAQQAFLDRLAATCNVTAAAKAAGFTTDTVYRQRRASSGFAVLWREALEIGYERLEEAMLEAAIRSLSPAAAPAPDGPVPPMTASEALNLLRLHKSAAKGGLRPTSGHRRRPDFDDVRASIVRKLEAIERSRAHG